MSLAIIVALLVSAYLLRKQQRYGMANASIAVAILLIILDAIKLVVTLLNVISS